MAGRNELSASNQHQPTVSERAEFRVESTVFTTTSGDRLGYEDSQRPFNKNDLEVGISSGCGHWCLSNMFETTSSCGIPGQYRQCLVILCMERSTLLEHQIIDIWRSKLLGNTASVSAFCGPTNWLHLVEIPSTEIAVAVQRPEVRTL